MTQLGLGDIIEQKLNLSANYRYRKNYNWESSIIGIIIIIIIIIGQCVSNFIQ